MINLKLLTRDTTDLPVSLDEVKAHLAIDYSSDDTRLTALIWDAVTDLEEETGRSFTPETYAYYLDRFPPFMPVYKGWQIQWAQSPLWEGFPYTPWRCRIYLPRPPLASVTSIQYYDLTNTQQTLDPSTYYTVTGDIGEGLIESVIQFPITYVRPDAVTITFSTSGQNPNDFKSVLKNLVAWKNENREGGDIPKSIERQINLLRYA